VENVLSQITVQSQDLTEITNGSAAVLNLTKVRKLNSQNAILVRDDLLTAGDCAQAAERYRQGQAE